MPVATLIIDMPEGNAVASRELARPTRLAFLTEEQDRANPWAYLSGYDFMEEPESGFSWLPGHA